MGVRDKIQGKEYLLRDLWNLLREGLHRLIRVLRLAAEEWDYLREPRNAESLKLLKKELFRVLSAILPKKGKGFIRIGLSDPYQTGRLMEAAALLYPVYGKQKVDVIPEFSESVFETDLDIRGRIYLITVLKAAVKLLMDRNLRAMYRHFTGEGDTDVRDQSGL